MNSLRVIAPELPFDIKFIELTQAEEEETVTNGQPKLMYIANHGILLWLYDKYRARRQI